MKRAISFLLALAAVAPAACSSTGGTQGPTISYTEQSQNPPVDSQEAVLNPNGPQGNSEQPPPNTNQPSIASAPASGGAVDACPIFCRNIDARCAARCAQTCAAYNIIAASCGEIAALITCVGSVGLMCSDTARLRLPEGACVSELSAALPCVEQFANNSPPVGTVTPAPAPSDTSSSGSGSIFDGGR